MSEKSEQPKSVSEDLVDLALAEQSEEFKARVLSVAYKAKVQPNDPLFLILLSTGQLELMLQRTPRAIELSFDRKLFEMAETLSATEKAAVQSQSAAIAQSVTALIQKAGSVQQQVQARHLQDSHNLLDGSATEQLKGSSGFSLGRFWQFVPILCAVGLGCLLGITVPVWLQGGYAGTVKLTQQQFEALKWAESKEGRYARDLMRWNSALLEGSPGERDCEKDVKRLGVTLEIPGKKAVSGFCVLWTQPSKSRQFVQSKAKSR